MWLLALINMASQFQAALSRGKQQVEPLIMTAYFPQAKTKEASA